MKDCLKLLKKLLMLFLCIVTVFQMFQLTKAETITRIQHPELSSFEIKDGNFTDGTADFVGKFSYGRFSMGALSITGNFDSKIESDDENIAIYGGSGDIVIGYSYDGAFQTSSKKDWNIVEDTDSKTFDGFEASKIKTGVVFIEKYILEEDDWITVAEYYDFFKKNKKGMEDLYTATPEETAGGTRFRVAVGYKMGRVIDTEKGKGLPLFNKDKDIYEYVSCIETYDFLLYTENQAVILKNIDNGQLITGNTTVENGFTLTRYDSLTDISVRHNDDEVFIGDSELLSFTDPGKYEVETVSITGKSATYILNVNRGITLVDLNPEMYESKKNKGFVNGNRLSETDTRDYIFTNVCLGLDQGVTYSQFEKSGYDAYGITGTSAAVYLQFRYSTDDFSDGFGFEYDKWGAKKKETVYGVNTGEIGTGALIVQTSKDGKTWKNANNGRYSAGLYNTDMANRYDDRYNILIYTPDGKDISEGVYIRVCYLYQTKYNGPGLFDDETFDYLEKYEFYLCSNELDAVTVHNLTLTENLETTLVDGDQNTAGAYKVAETLLDGSATVTGFTIDTSLNPTVKINVEKNGKSLIVPRNKTFRDDGKYTIHVTNAVGDSKTSTVYIDKSSVEQAYKNYFGDSFIEGKRVYSDGDYPTFEGGTLKYNIEAVDEILPCIGGTITNKTTGHETVIIRDRTAKSGVIIEPGEYIARLTTGETDDNLAGDYRKFTFQFTVIGQGKAPGPQINENNLYSHIGLAASDCYPVYYGVTYSSAGPGNITLAFANRKDAVAFAAEYEKGVVEKQPDGKYRYRGSLNVHQKSGYKDGWDLTEAVNYYAEQAVETLYFDLSDEFTYRTLPVEIIDTTKNLRTLELEKSVVIYADNYQKNELCSKSGLPLINDKDVVSINPGLDKKENKTVNTFEFIKDKYGYDSSSVQITDQTGKIYNVKYNESIEKQLSLQDCPSGVLTVKETNIYGDTNEYKTLYIAENDNKAVITINSNEHGKKEKRIISASDNGEEFITEGFTIESIADKLDPCSVVLVEKDGVKSAYVANEKVKGKFAERGKYNITSVNRMGYKYSVTVIVQ